MQYIISNKYKQHNTKHKTEQATAADRLNARYDIARYVTKDVSKISKDISTDIIKRIMSALSNGK